MKHRTSLAIVFMCLVLMGIPACQKQEPQAKPQAVSSVSFTIWRTWKTIKLGTHKSANTLRQAIKEQGYLISDWANDNMGKPAFTVNQKETDIDLVLVTTRKLGLEKEATRQQIYDRALEQGLQLCPNEVGPQLRLQYPDQPVGEWIIVAMEFITDSQGGQGMFYVGHNSRGRWLESNSLIAGHLWVFVRLKSE